MTAHRLALLVVPIAVAAFLVLSSFGGGRPMAATAAESGAMPTHENTGPNEPLTGPDLTANQWVKRIPMSVPTIRWARP